MNGRSSDLLLGSGSVARRRGVLFCDLLSTLPEGRPLPCTASTSILVISCERVRCSIAARRLSDSFSSLGTYAPINTPFRLAISLSHSFYSSPTICPAIREIHKPNSVTPRCGAVIIRLGRLLPDGSCDLPGNASRIAPGTRTSSPVLVSLFGLAPRGVCLAADVTTRAGELLPHHFTHHRKGWTAFCCTCRRLHSRRPAVNRLDALRCSDFPLPGFLQEAITGYSRFMGRPLL